MSSGTAERRAIRWPHRESGRHAGQACRIRTVCPPWESDWEGPEDSSLTSAQQCPAKLIMAWPIEAAPDAPHRLQREELAARPAPQTPRRKVMASVVSAGPRWDNPMQ